MKSEHDRFMALAIEEALTGLRAGERPFGSVIVKDGKVVGQGRNLVNSTQDPTAHAETVAIRNASANLKTARLTGCTLYTTCEPCPMCCGATLYAGIDTLVMGTRQTNLPRLSKGAYNVHDYNVDRLVELTGFKLNIVTGVMTEDCDAIYGNWDGWGTGYPFPRRS